MLTIENIDKLSNCIGYNMEIDIADTHYTFRIDVNGETLEITLARHKPKYMNGKPHPHNDQYLFQSHSISWIHNWLYEHDMRDIWNVASLIERYINEVKC